MDDRTCAINVAKHIVNIKNLTIFTIMCVQYNTFEVFYNV